MTDLSPSDGAAQIAYASKLPYTGALLWHESDGCRCPEGPWLPVGGYGCERCGKLTKDMPEIYRTLLTAGMKPPAYDPTGLRTLAIALGAARLQAHKVTVPGVSDIVAALNDLIAGVEELQR